MLFACNRVHVARERGEETHWAGVNHDMVTSNWNLLR